MADYRSQRGTQGTSFIDLIETINSLQQGGQRQKTRRDALHQDVYKQFDIDSESIYKDSIQKILFQMDIGDGPIPDII